jgi:hypothetical protein
LNIERGALGPAREDRMAQHRNATDEDIRAYWRANPRASIDDAKEALSTGYPRIKRIKQEVAAERARMAAEARARAPEGNNPTGTISGGSPSYQSGTAPTGAGPARAPDAREGKGTLTGESTGGTSRESEVRFSQNGDEATVEAPRTSIRTLEGLLEAAQVDLGAWEVEKHVVNKWDAYSDERGITELFQVKAWLKRKRDELAILAVRDAALEAMRAHAPAYRPLPRLVKANPHALVLGIPDTHLGKRGNASETREGWNTDAACAAFLGSLDALLARAASFNVERIVFPVGNDLVHADSSKGTTTKGTPLDMDGSYWQSVLAAQRLLVEAVDRCLSVAKVDVVVVPGNHARETEIHLGQYLAAWYSKASEVTVDASPRPRKYLRHGVSLFGFTHGDEERHASLPQLMALEAAQDWPLVRHREWFLGHEHRKREAHFLPLAEAGGVRIRVLPSLSGADAWHASRGFVGGLRAAEAYLYSSSEGYAGHFSVTPAFAEVA